MELLHFSCVGQCFATRAVGLLPLKAWRRHWQCHCGMAGAELAGCIIAAVQGREVVIHEATGVDGDEDEEDVEISEDDEIEDGEEEEEGVGFHNFARRPRSQRKRALIDSPDPTSEGAPHSPISLG